MHRSVLLVALLVACGDNYVGNTPPTINDLNLTTAEDTPLTRQIDAEDAEGDPIDITFGQPAHGTVTRSGASLVYTPAANYNGPDSFTITASDGRDQASATVNITVTAVNDAPIGTADSFATNEDVAHEAELSALLANDSDPDGDTLTVTAVGSAANGSVAMAGGDVIFTPTADFVGNGSYTYTVSDGTLTTEVAVTVTIGGVNDAPIATDDTGMTDEDTDFVVAATALTGNDMDPDMQTLTITSVDNATNGMALLDQGMITFVPAANFNGTATFDYTVSDGALTDTGTVTVTVTSVNDAPVATDDAATTDEEVAVTVTAATLLANDSDVETTPTISGAGNAVGGSVTVAGNGDITFTPDPNFFGAGSFEYTISDGTANDTGVVTVTVANVQDAPDAVADAAMTNEDTAVVITSAALLANDVDVDNEALSVTSVGNAVGGAVVRDTNTGDITFTPAANFAGTASFDYTITDGHDSDTATVSVTVTAVNDAPDAVADTGNATEDTPLQLASTDLLANDTDPDTDTLTITSVGNAVNGTVVLDTNTGTVTFTPAAEFAGTASFDYTISDGNGGSDTATVTITVTAANDAPTAGPDSAQAQSGVAATYTTAQFLANDTDPDGPAALTITAVGNASNGTVTLAGSDIIYQSTVGFTGTATFDYTVSDSVATSTGTVTVNVVDGLTCGDGFVAGAETCDDDGTANGDGCNMLCQTEPGWTCANPPGQPSTCTEICGDAMAVGDEPCDDGNADETDGCTSLCTTAVVCNATAYPGADRFAVDVATGTCYASFDDDQTTFATAQSACVGVGGHLATVTSAAEQAIVNSVQNTAQNPWIGASEDGNDTDAVFDWVTDEAFGFTAFATNEPDDDVGVGGTGDCLHLANAAGEWGDTNCDFAMFVTGRICEFALDTCGDAILQTAQAEECDDGNTTDGDGCSATCQDEPFVAFSFTGAAGNETSLPADAQAAGLDAMPTMVRGAGVNPSSAANTFSAVAWTTAAALDATEYFAFTVTPSTGVSMTMTSLEIDERRSGTGPRTWSVRSSLDGFTTDLAVFSVPDDTNTRANQLVTLPAAFTNVTTAVEFRLYGYASEASTGTWRIDNVELYGDLTLP